MTATRFGGPVLIGTLLAASPFTFSGCTPTPAVMTPSAASPSAGSVPAPSDDLAVGPAGERHGVPVGWSHDRAGAEAAAVAYVEATDLVAHAGPLGRRDIVLTMATPAFGPTLLDTTNRQLDDLLFALGARGVAASSLVWSEHALTVTTAAEAPDVCEVRVWSVLVLAVLGGSTPRQVWRTSNLTLRWVNGDWKVDRWATTPGPLPAPPSEAEIGATSSIAEVTGWVRAHDGRAR